MTRWAKGRTLAHMSLPAAGYPLSAAVSPRLQVRETSTSTNTELVREATDDPSGHPHLSVLLTTDQRSGRGRLDRSWTAPPGTALAVSVVLDIHSVAIADRGWIPLLAGAAMVHAVQKQLRDLPVDLKWPNDVRVEGLKICGILAEVLPGNPDRVVVGAGVNTRMAEVDLPVDTATSFAALGRTSDDDRLLADYLTALRDALAQLGEKGPSAIRADVETVCSTIGAAVTVSLPGGEVLAGTATGLADDGRLVVSTDAGERAVAAGDVVHVRARA